MERLQQIRLAFQQTREVDDKLVPLMVGVGLVALALPILLAVILGLGLVTGIIAGVLIGPTAALVVLSRRAMTAQYGMIEGRPGAALAVLQAMRGPWHVTPAVAVNRKQDLVHRVVGRPGVILIGEGSATRVRPMLKKERTRMERVAGDVPVREVIVGEAEGQVSLRKLRIHITKMGRDLKKSEAAALERKLAALGGDDIPIPKGYIPRGGRPR